MTTNTKPKHTPLPWTVSYSDHDNNCPIYFLENVLASATEEEHQANARLIAHACNSHYELLEELKNIIAGIEKINSRSDFTELLLSILKAKSLIAEVQG